MQRVFVESATLGSAGHDARSTVLELQFRNGAVYQYFRVPRRIYCDLLRADSKGGYFNQNIRGKCPYQADPKRDSSVSTVTPCQADSLRDPKLPVVRPATAQPSFTPDNPAPTV